MRGLAPRTGAVALVAAVTLVALSGVPAGAATAPNLGSATPFAVLAGTTITNTGPTVISGDIGLAPGTSITGFPPGLVLGTSLAADAASLAAQNSSTAAYGVAAGETPFSTIAGGTLGGTTLAPGTYKSASALAVNGTVTLNGGGDASAVFIFQAGSTLTTASSSTIALEGGAQACNVFWQVGSSATLGTSSSFVGTILAQTSITLNTGANVMGRLLAQTGAVTLEDNTITVATCLATSAYHHDVHYRAHHVHHDGHHESTGEEEAPGGREEAGEDADRHGKARNDDDDFAIRPDDNSRGRASDRRRGHGRVGFLGARTRRTPRDGDLGDGGVARGSRATTRPVSVHGRARRFAWWGTAGVALVIGVAAIVATLPSHTPKQLVLSQSASPSTTTLPTTIHSRVVIPAIPGSRPVELSIPAIKVTTAIGTLGLQPDHQVMVPTNPHTVDWYVDGPPPGKLGSAVILGHVDSFRGPGTFFNLKLLRAGDHISVVLADGTVTHFIVTRVVQYAKSSFPDRLVYGSHGTRSLQLVTCGGVFNHTTGHYESNIVVFSTLAGVSVPHVTS